MLKLNNGNLRKTNDINNFGGHSLNNIIYSLGSDVGTCMKTCVGIVIILTSDYCNYIMTIIRYKCIMLEYITPKT